MRSLHYAILFFSGVVDIFKQLLSCPNRVTFVKAKITYCSSPPLFLAIRFWESCDQLLPGFFLEAREKTLGTRLVVHALIKQAGIWKSFSVENNPTSSLYLPISWSAETWKILTNIPCQSFFFGLRWLTTIFEWKLSTFSNWNIFSIWKHWNNVVIVRNNVATMLQLCVALKIVFANRLV